MAETSLQQLGRLVGGTALLQGTIGHRVLGQLLISGSSSVEVAAVSAALAATAGQPNAAVQIAFRSVLPALAVYALSHRQREQTSGWIARNREGDDLATETPVPAIVREMRQRKAERRMGKLEAAIRSGTQHQRDAQATMARLEKGLAEIRKVVADLSAAEPPAPNAGSGIRAVPAPGSPADAAAAAAEPRAGSSAASADAAPPAGGRAAASAEGESGGTAVTTAPADSGPPPASVESATPKKGPRKQASRRSATAGSATRAAPARKKRTQVRPKTPDTPKGDDA